MSRAFAVIGSWEDLRAPEVAKWQHKNRIEWDVTDGRNGGSSTHCMRDLAGDGKIELQSELVSLPVVWAGETRFNFSRVTSGVLCGSFDHQRNVQFDGCVADPRKTITASLLGSK